MQVSKLDPTGESYRELVIAFEHFNQELFEGHLPSVMFTLPRSKRTLGYFSPARFINRKNVKVHEIALNPSVFASESVDDVMSILVHEMCHLSEHIAGTASRGGYHNKSWATKMHSVGLCPSSTGQPGGAQVGEQMMHYIIDGGRFQKSCKRLLETHPGIVWFDRYVMTYSAKVMPRQPPASPLPGAQVIAGGQTVSEAVGSGADPVKGKSSGKVKPPPPPIAPPTSKPWVEEATELDVVRVEPEGRSRRFKFKCTFAGCKQQAWGKPGLMIDCGKHKVRMTAAPAS